MVFFNSSVSQEDLTLLFFSFGESADFLVSHTYAALTGSVGKWDPCSCCGEWDPCSCRGSAE